MHPSWKLHTTGYTTWLKAAGRRTNRTIQTRTYWVTRLARDYPNQSPVDLTLEQLVAWIANPRWSSTTKKSALASVRGLYQYLKATEAIAKAPTDKLLSISVPRKLQPPAPYTVFTQAVQDAQTQELL